MVKAGLVYGVATEDMDALTFGSPKLLRHLTFSANRKEPILEIDLQTVLSELKLNMTQFIDLCILMGCDYTGTIRGVGPQTALKLIHEWGSIEEALKHIDKEKFKSGNGGIGEWGIATVLLLLLSQYSLSFFFCVQGG